MSESPSCGFGQRSTQSIASCCDFTSKIQKPATSSFASANGPSTTVRVFSLKWTRTPFELGWSPSPLTITPAAASSSLYFCIALNSSTLGILPASLFAFAFTMTRNRIVVSFVRAPVPPAPGGIRRNVDRCPGEIDTRRRAA